MKETSIVAPVFKCTGCKYWSLHKTHTSNHITKKCPEAKIVSKKKIIKHQDPNNERDDVATLYQCSKCSYTSYQPSPVNTHIKKCPGAELIKEQRKLFIEDVPPEPSITEQLMPKPSITEQLMPKPSITEQLMPKSFIESSVVIFQSVRGNRGGGRKKSTLSSQKPTFGYFYCIVPVDTPFIKIGITTASICHLTTRYNTYYGECEVFTTDCEDYRRKEQSMKKELRRLNLLYRGRNGELAINTDITILLYKTISSDNRHT